MDEESTSFMGWSINQIDTDIAEEFSCSKNQSVEELIECVIQRMVDKIDSKERFYTENREKIIFAISVHSLECWLLSIYSKSEKIHTCEDKLKKEVSKISKKLKTEKNYRNYDKLSQDFLKYKKLMTIASQNSSFQVFINNLPLKV